MYAMHAVSIHVIRKTAAAADAANNHEFLPRHAELGECALEGIEDRIVTATGAPADVVRRDEVLAVEGGDERRRRRRR